MTTTELKSKIRLKLGAYDHRLLDKYVQSLTETVKHTGAKVVGPIPLPTKISRYTILRSTHVDKKSREQFELRFHKRILEIIEPTLDTLQALLKMELPAGIHVDIKQL
jgi:small subunit ribosomal protein S10